MFFSIYHHYGPYGQIDVVRIIVCPFEKDECPTHVISAKGFVSEVNSLLVFTFGHQESRIDSLALLCKGLTSDVWKYVVEVNSSEMQPEGNLSFDPVWYVFCANFLSYWLWFSCLGNLILWFQHMAMVQIQTKDFLSCFDLSGSRVLLLTIQSSNSFKTMHGMLFQLCVHVLIFVMLAFFYCLIAWQLFKIFRIVTAPFIAIRETALFPQDGPSCFCLMETRVQVQTFQNQDMAGAGFEPTIFRRAPLLPKLRGHFAEFLQHGSLKRPSIIYLFTCVGLGYGQFTGRIALPIRSFFLEVSTLLTMTTVTTINRLATMAGRYALLSCDPYSNEEMRVRGRGGSPRPDHPIHSNRLAWFCSQSNFVTFVFPGVGKAKWGHPSPLSALPRAIDIMRATEIDFAENQLYPILVGLSPLATSHPCILPHTWVRSSKNSMRTELESGPPFSRKAIRIRTRRIYWEGSNIGNESIGLSPSLARSSNLFTITVHCAISMKGACWFFHHPIHNKSNETWRKRSEHFAAEEFIILERETKLRSKERRLAADLGYGFPIGDPWITDGISPWPFASENVLPSQCPDIHPMHSFRSCIQTNECANAAFASIPCLFISHRLHKRYTEDQPNLDENQYTQLHLHIQRPVSGRFVIRVL
ncbi:hypothetical protein JHK82_048045 [Glycine max]|nr:hypothetical protein JHK82_048045 [Glycine max]